ncbi:MAG TPA: ABC transporter permease, partial [Enteractinococcus helveticum]|nr:ABC transporter permease [Enteractinococcus helveticum]
MKLRKTSLVALEIITPLLLLALWWVLSANSESAYNPPLSEIMARFGENWFGERFFSDLLPSLGRMFGGFFLAVIIGTGIGSIVGLSKIARRLTSPIVSFLRSIPGAALLPPAVLLLGIGNEMKISVIAFICIWPIMLNTIDGIDETHATMTNTARVLQIRGYR